MIKLYGIIAVIFSFLFFTSCSDYIFSPDLFQRQTAEEEELPEVSFNSLYGNYLAGQLAFIRNDYDASSKYLSQAYELDPENKQLPARLYMIYAAAGDLEKSAEYARLAENYGEKANTIYIIEIVESMVNAQYDSAIENANKIQKDMDILIQPTVKVWAYAGQNKREEALAELEKLNFEKSDKDNNDYYIYNKAMLYEYFSMPQEAKVEYEKLIALGGNDLSFYNYSAIMEFYIRNGFREDAEKLAERSKYIGYIREAKEEYTKRLMAGENEVQYHLVSPQVAISDMMIYISAWLTQLKANPELSYFYMRMAGYVNPNNMFLQYIIALHLDYFGLHDEAMKYYAKIDEPSYIKYAAKLKIADILIAKHEYKEAEQLLKNLRREFPNNEELHFKIGDTLRMSGRNEEAFNYYSMLLKEYPDKYEKDWGIYYALGATCDRGGNIDKAEEYLKKALKLSNNNYIVQNHLGYLWLENDKNITEAFSLIAHALSKAPRETHIIDSMGWAFFKIGDYKRAIMYLEAAVDRDSGNALMNDHLGDAYWAGGRKTEAIYQWNHAMYLKEDAEEVNKDRLQEKIENGLTDYEPITNYNYLQIKKLIKEFKL